MSTFTGPGVALTNLTTIAQSLDFITIMAYDDVGPSWSTTSGPNAPLYSTCNPSGYTKSVDSAVKVWIAAGFQAKQLVVGLPAYGYGYGGVAKLVTTQTPGGPSQLYQSFTKPEGSLTGDAGGVDACGVYEKPGGQWLFTELIKNNKLSSTGLQGASGYMRIFDNCTKTPLLYSSADQLLISYDDTVSFTDKATYVKDNGFGGVNMFDMTGDTADSLLINAARTVLLGETPAQPVRKQRLCK